QLLRGTQRKVRLNAGAVSRIEGAARCVLLPDDDRLGDLGALRLGTFVNDLLKKPSCTSLVLALDARDCNEREAQCARKPRYPRVCHRPSSESVSRERGGPLCDAHTSSLSVFGRQIVVSTVVSCQGVNAVLCSSITGHGGNINHSPYTPAPIFGIVVSDPSA